MLPSDYRWEEHDDGQGLYLHEVAPYPCRCGYWAPARSGIGILVHRGVRDCMPNQRLMATPEGARRFMEAWVTKWDADIRSLVRNKGAGEKWNRPSPEVSEAASSRDYARRRGRRSPGRKGPL